MKTLLSALMFSLVAASPAVAAENASASALACKIQKDRTGWLQTLERTESRWGVTVEAQLALIAEEWGYTADDLPSFWRPGWTFPGRSLPSIPPGYQEATWNRYKFETGNKTASFKSFEDMSDFIGWYISTAADQVGLLPGDAGGIYILWKEGPRYYRSNQWVNNAAMIYRSQHFAHQAQQISEGFQTCFVEEPAALETADESPESTPPPETSGRKLQSSRERKKADGIIRQWSWRMKRGPAD